MVVDPAVEAEQVERLKAWRAARDAKAVDDGARRARGRRQGRPQHHGAVDRLRQGRRHDRRVGRSAAPRVRRVPRADRRCAGRPRHATAAASRRCARPSRRSPTRLGRRIKFLVGKPGLDGHSNGAEQIAVRARDCGMEVVYEGIRLTPAQIVRAALDESVHVVGLSILSGSHVPLVQDVMERMRAEGLDDVPVVVGGIIPPEDARPAQGDGRRRRLHAQGLPAQRHHGRHRAAGGWSVQGRLTGRPYWSL